MNLFVGFDSLIYYVHTEVNKYCICFEENVNFLWFIRFI